MYSSVGLEQWPFKPVVLGSSPNTGSILKFLGRYFNGRILVCHAGECGFESHPARNLGYSLVGRTLVFDIISIGSNPIALNLNKRCDVMVACLLWE